MLLYLFVITSCFLWWWNYQAPSYWGFLWRCVVENQIKSFWLLRNLVQYLKRDDLDSNHTSCLLWWVFLALRYGKLLLIYEVNTWHLDWRCLCINLTLMHWKTALSRLRLIDEAVRQYLANIHYAQDCDENSQLQNCLFLHLIK